MTRTRFPTDPRNPMIRGVFGRAGENARGSTSQTHRHEGGLGPPPRRIHARDGHRRRRRHRRVDRAPSPTPASSGLQLVVSSPGVAPLVRHNVAFGEVWLCSGQSNMQLAMAGAFDADADIADSGNYPLMRFATLKMQAYTVPVNDVPPYITVEPYKDIDLGDEFPRSVLPAKVRRGAWRTRRNPTAAGRPRWGVGSARCATPSAGDCTATSTAPCPLV